MTVTQEDLDESVRNGILAPEQADRLWHFLGERHVARHGVAVRPERRFGFASVAYYSGALVVISAMGWFMTEAWESFGGAALFAIAATYAVVFVLAGRALWAQNDLRTPGGLLFVMAVCMTPLAVYGLQRFLGFWPEDAPGAYRDFHVWVKARWLPMELATLAAAALALRFVRFPLLTAPIAFVLWYMSMDLTPILFGQETFTWDQRLWVSLVFGLVMLVAAYLVDRRAKDFAFWGYLFGLLAFWGGLSLMNSDSELGRFFYCLVNVALILCSVVLQRKVFLVFGALGVFGYLGHLSYRVFADSILFPLVLTGIGLALIYLGVKYQKNQDAIERFVQARLPKALQDLSPDRK